MNGRREVYKDEHRQPEFFIIKKERFFHRFQRQVNSEFRKKEIINLVHSILNL